MAKQLTYILSSLWMGGVPPGIKSREPRAYREFINTEPCEQDARSVALLGLALPEVSYRTPTGSFASDRPSGVRLVGSRFHLYILTQLPAA